MLTKIYIIFTKIMWWLEHWKYGYLELGCYHPATLGHLDKNDHLWIRWINDYHMKYHSLITFPTAYVEQDYEIHGYIDKYGSLKGLS